LPPHLHLAHFNCNHHLPPINAALQSVMARRSVGFGALDRTKTSTVAPPSHA
jgi:hypothetical protein